MYIGIIAPTLERKHSPTKQRFELYHHVHTLCQCVCVCETERDWNGYFQTSVTRLRLGYFQSVSLGFVLVSDLQPLPCAHTHTHTHPHTHLCAHLSAPISSHIYAHTHTHPHAHPHMHTHIHTHTRTHAHTHTHA